MRRKSSAAASGRISKFATETMRSSAGTDERVLLRGVELDLELAANERERVAQRAVQLRQPAEGERVLEVPRRAGLPERAALEQRAQAGRATRSGPGTA